MDIAALSTAMAQSDIQNQLGASLLGKALDLSSQTGEAITQMIDASSLEQSVTPYLGGMIDISI